MPVHLDTSPTSPSLLTLHKTTSRDHYLLARSRAGLGDGYAVPEEVLLFNPEGEITEASFSNVAFWREEAWRTPKVESGGLGGVMRRWLIERGAWMEGTVRKADVVKGEFVLLSTGVRGAFAGIVV